MTFVFHSEKSVAARFYVILKKLHVMDAITLYVLRIVRQGFMAIFTD